ncbi:MAG: acyl-CoA dehydrogenase family protein [Halioglobus sp.]
MKLSLNDEQLMLQDSVSRFVRDHCGVEVCRSLRDSQQVLDGALWQQMAELGWLSLPFSEADGGLGGSHVEVMVLMQELGRGLVVQPYVSTVLTCGALLARCDTAIKTRFLEPLIAGQSLWAFAFAEQQGGYQLNAVTTTATRDGDGFRLDGEKIAVVNGAAADHLLVTATVAGASAPGLFLVEDASCTTRRPVALIDGSPGAAIEFSSTPAIQVAEDGLPLVEAVVDELIIAMGAQALGSMEALLEMTVEYTKTREQFGQPISKFQVLQHRMADMYMQCEALKSLLYDAVLAHLEQRTDRAQASSALKVKLGEAGRFVSQQAVQLHGGMGMSDELAVGHHFKALIQLNTMYGDSGHHLDRFLALGDCA